MIWIGLGILLIFGLTAFIGAPYLPSKSRDIEKLLDDLDLSADDKLLDVGSGDGVVLLAAARRGVKAIGYEVNPFLVAISRWRLRRHFKLAEVKLVNAWQAKPEEKIDVIYAFGAGIHMAKIYQLAKKQAKHQGMSLRLVSYAFEVEVVEGDRLLKQSGVYFIYQINP